MRITTGIYKGREIKSPAGIRPTQNMPRKAVFDILGDISGLSFLELFAGSGAVGIEAASRGAKELVFVESNPSVIKVLEQNLSYIPRTKHCVLPQDAQIAIKRLAQEGRKFDIIFLDPPYYKSLAPRLSSGSTEPTQEDSLTKNTLQTLEAYDILSPAGLIVIEHSRQDRLPETLGVLSLLRQKHYGGTVLSFYKRLL